PVQDVAARFEPMATRLTDSDLLVLADAPEPAPRGFGRGGGAPRGNRNVDANANAKAAGGGAAERQPPGPRFQMSPEMRAQMALGAAKLKFLADHGAAMTIDPSRQGDG